MVEGQTCASQGYDDIESYSECDDAFDYLVVPKESTSYEHVDNGGWSFYPKGCFSQCYSAYAGYFCRKFNSHSTGDGTGTDVSEDIYIICRNPEGKCRSAVE
jgi:hypothetical protein